MTDTEIESPKDIPEINSQLFEARLKSQEILKSYLTQIISLSSAVLVVTIAFVPNLVGKGETAVDPSSLYLAWAMFGLASLISVYGIVYQINLLDVPNTDVGRSGIPKVYAAGTSRVILHICQAAIISFTVGFVSLCVFASDQLGRKPPHGVVASEENALRGIENAIRDTGATMEKTLEGIRDAAIPAPRERGMDSSPKETADLLRRVGNIEVAIDHLRIRLDRYSDVLCKCAALK